MSMRRDLFPEENARLLKIYQSQSDLTVHEVVEKFASDEFKAYLKDAKEEAKRLSMLPD